MIHNDTNIFNQKLNFRNFLSIFTKNQLISHYTHLGFKTKLLNQGYKKAILGTHSNLAIIDPNITLSTTKNFSKFLFNLLLSNRPVGFLFGEDLHPSLVHSIFNMQNNYYIFNSWPNGLLSNKGTLRLCWKLHLSKIHSFPNFPSALFVFNFNPSKLEAITKESRVVGMPLFCLADSLNDLSLLDYYTPSNTSSLITKIFWLKYFNSFLLKIKLYRIKNFYERTKTFSNSLLLNFLEKKNLYKTHLYYPNFRSNFNNLAFKPKFLRKNTRISKIVKLKRHLNHDDLRWFRRKFTTGPLKKKIIIKIKTKQKNILIFSKNYHLIFKKSPTKNFNLTTYIKNYKKKISFLTKKILISKHRNKLSNSSINFFLTKLHTNFRNFKICYLNI